MASRKWKMFRTVKSSQQLHNSCRLQTSSKKSNWWGLTTHKCKTINMQSDFIGLWKILVQKVIFWYADTDWLDIMTKWWPWKPMETLPYCTGYINTYKCYKVPHKARLLWCIQKLGLSSQQDSLAKSKRLCWFRNFVPWELDQKLKWPMRGM
jgi:hypothetical protein